jgi:hypothetical protein
MRSALRRRFWVEAGMGLLTAVLFVVTLVQQSWIESLFGIDPDSGNGSVEWIIVGGLALLTVALFSLASYERGRASAMATAA